MRYDNVISQPSLALFDLPTTKYDQINTKGRKSLFEEVWKRLLVFDHIPDNDFGSVLNEARYSLEVPDPGFETLFHGDFESFIASDRHLYKWQKIKKDYNFFTRSELKRRNIGNPYHNQNPLKIETWDELPDFSREKRNQTWQFDNLYRDSQSLAGEIYELTKDYAQKQDKDMFRAKINSILVPDKIISALNSGEHVFEFMENELILANTKISLDSYKLAYTFTVRTIESLHKMRWNYEAQSDIIDPIIASLERFLEKLRNRISEIERRFMLFYEAI